MDAKYVNERLDRIAKLLFLNANYNPNIGLLNGKLGIAIFFYHYALFTRKKIHKKYADELIREIFLERHKHTSLDYENGLAGIGTGLNYLLNKGFIDQGYGKFLLNLDLQLNNSIRNYIPAKLKFNELLGYGKYFNSRLKSSSIEDLGDQVLYRESLLSIVDLLDRPFNTYSEINNAIEFLVQVCRISGESQKPKDFLNYAIDKLETSVNEDIHFKVYPGDFNPLAAARAILSFPGVSNGAPCWEKAKYFLALYEHDFDKYLSDKSHSLKAGSFNQVFLFDYLFRKTGNENYRKKAQEWFDKSMVEDKQALTGFIVGINNNVPELGLWDGYAGIGLSIIDFLQNNEADWHDLIPN
jgi:hypothetical protein